MLFTTMNALASGVSDGTVGEAEVDQDAGQDQEAAQAPAFPDAGAGEEAGGAGAGAGPAAGGAGAGAGHSPHVLGQK